MKEAILYDVSLAFGITWHALATPVEGRQTNEIVEAKQVAAYLLWGYTRLTGDQIANMLGYKDRRNIAYCKNKVKEIMEGDKSFRLKVEGIKDGLIRE